MLQLKMSLLKELHATVVDAEYGVFDSILDNGILINSNVTVNSKLISTVAPNPVPAQWLTVIGPDGTPYKIDLHALV